MYSFLSKIVTLSPQWHILVWSKQLIWWSIVLDAGTLLFHMMGFCIVRQVLVIGNWCGALLTYCRRWWQLLIIAIFGWLLLGTLYLHINPRAPLNHVTVPRVYGGRRVWRSVHHRPVSREYCLMNVALKGRTSSDTLLFLRAEKRLLLLPSQYIPFDLLILYVKPLQPLQIYLQK